MRKNILRRQLEYFVTGQRYCPGHVFVCWGIFEKVEKDIWRSQEAVDIFCERKKRLPWANRRQEAQSGWKRPAPDGLFIPKPTVSDQFNCQKHILKGANMCFHVFVFLCMFVSKRITTCLNPDMFVSRWKRPEPDGFLIPKPRFNASDQFE